jgi:hypothetical protein
MSQRSLWKFAIPAVFLGSSLATIVPATAQNEGAQQASVDTTPACMTGSLQNVEQVKQANKGKRFPIIIAVSDVPLLESVGFERIECSASVLNSQAKRTAFRDRVCELAAYGNEAVQDQVEKAVGVDSGVLCGSAELAVGPWVPKVKPKIEQ